MNKLSIRDLEMNGKRVFIRVDFNVPLMEARRHRRHAHPRNPAHAALAIERGARLCWPRISAAPRAK
jgi:hypothetical protein